MLVWKCRMRSGNQPRNPTELLGAQVKRECKLGTSLAMLAALCSRLAWYILLWLRG